MTGNGTLRRAVQAAAHVTELALATAVGLFVGSKLDAWLGTAPWLLFGGALLGFAGGLLRLIQGLSRLMETDDDPPHDPS
jgi:F0F1-type ATP synthase assembly protein I